MTLYNKVEVLSEFEKSEEQAASPVQIGQDVAKVEEFLALAKEGCGFLVVYAPKGERSETRHYDRAALWIEVCREVQLADNRRIGLGIFA